MRKFELGYLPHGSKYFAVAVALDDAYEAYHAEGFTKDEARRNLKACLIAEIGTNFALSVPVEAAFPTSGLENNENRASAVLYQVYKFCTELMWNTDSPIGLEGENLLAKVNHEIMRLRDIEEAKARETKAQQNQP